MWCQIALMDRSLRWILSTPNKGPKNSIKSLTCFAVDLCPWPLTSVLAGVSFPVPWCPQGQRPLRAQGLLLGFQPCPPPLSQGKQTRGSAPPCLPSPHWGAGLWLWSARSPSACSWAHCSQLITGATATPSSTVGHGTRFCTHRELFLNNVPFRWAEMRLSCPLTLKVDAQGWWVTCSDLSGPLLPCY